MTRDRDRLAPRLYQQAADMLAQEISQGLLPRGTALTQKALAERFGISRSPARQALDELVRRGLLLRGASGRYSLSGQTADPGLSGRMPVPARLTQRSSWEGIYPEIELAIVSRTPLGCWRVNEAVLARHYGVSRTVARDVMGRLQNRGIIRKDDSGRWHAPALTAQHIDELYELRWLLEPVAMEKAVPNLPAGLLDAMSDELLAAMEGDAQRDSTLLDHLEQRLHVELLGHCRNEALVRAISLPQALLVTHQMLYQLTLELFGTEPFLSEHLEVINRLRRGDIDGARAALVAHLRISRRRAMLRIEAVQEMIQPDPLPYLERVDPPEPG
ncbi:GntR family transcriptional regulator [Paracoccus sp. MBLB3053]|uniref:GntR family transcriptional regulator n=1 Tax=Paracoccus aurantius TaxID=3073814 RepID=A0ABU2HM34_9RHOB|nr:GntR family transcriptional regulator [Paracoccus sp. MBLB3053]MDS9466102.1 GntR family transcriptional regulator [Paracoccus sp. MBLB3053]